MTKLRAATLASLLMIGFALPSPAHAQGQQKVAVLPMSGVNIHAGYLEAARDIFKDHLMGTGRFYVIGVPGHPPDHEYLPNEAVDLGKTVLADLVATTHIVHLSGTARVRLTVFRVSDGSIAHTDGLTTAGGPDDLDPVLKRLAVGFATGKPVAQTGEIDSVTQKEADPYLKQTATRVFGLRLAAAVPFGRASGDTSSATGLGLFWLYDARDFMAEIWIDFFTSSAERTHMFDVGMGGYYPFSKKNFTPYLGAGAAWSASTLGGDGASGLRINPAFGLLMGRLWSVQVRAELGYFFNLYGEKASYTGVTPQPATTNSATHYGHGPMLTLGLGI
ncbi:MAG TPA: hypothetical protein VN914_11080 [Polyangia bacterium]|nr:hypothetical protein [Polyangia bacterium]